MLQFFDAHVRDEALTREVLEHLRTFNVRTVLLAAHSPRSFETTDDLMGYFFDLVTGRYQWLVHAGMQPWVALGVQPRALPRRAHYELWRELPLILSEPQVAAMGELCLEQGGSREEALLARQLAMAASLDLPVLVTASRQERARKVRRILEVISSVGIDPTRVLVNHLDYTCIRSVLDAGCWAGVTVGPFHLAPSDAAEMLRRYGEAALSRAVFNSGFRLGPADVLALPKAAVALSERGFSSSQVRQLVWSNAVRLLLQDRSVPMNPGEEG
ncbi:MAG: hypothetical protein JW797_11670 [Bradymonadales bacterium]|nr:hypothetical protein [Bradymonadales bacterium]